MEKFPSTIIQNRILLLEILPEYLYRGFWFGSFRNKILVWMFGFGVYFVKVQNENFSFGNYSKKFSKKFSPDVAGKWFLSRFSGKMMIRTGIIPRIFNGILKQYHTLSVILLDILTGVIGYNSAECMHSLASVLARTLAKIVRLK